MLAECSYRYPDGRNCRRIPRRGESLCPDHRRQAAVRHRTEAAERAFQQQANQAADEIIRLPLNRLLDHAQECLMDIEPFIEANASPARRVRFMRAMTALTASIDCVCSQAEVLSQAVPNIPEDAVRAMLLLLWCARPNYAAQAQALAARDSAVPPASISKQSDALQNQSATQG
ncbi:MAG TPA: hypothetical protein VJS11_13620 [Acidobacteriaceae bacterium]|nr:hypothetical protein [Acidobacteriaceae bacterium]